MSGIDGIDTSSMEKTKLVKWCVYYYVVITMLSNCTVQLLCLVDQRVLHCLSHNHFGSHWKKLTLSMNSRYHYIRSRVAISDFSCVDRYRSEHMKVANQKSKAKLGET